jgi:signal transduction histidine kinase
MLPDYDGAGLLSPNPNTVLADLEQQVALMIEQVHHLAWELRPAVLDNVGLGAALAEYVSDWSRNSGVTVDMMVSPQVPDDLSLTMQSTLYRVTQEALTNVARHAKATVVSVMLSSSLPTAHKRGAVRLVISDNGRGFNTRVASSRLGVQGMQERMQLVGGSLEIESAPKQGTSVFASIPLEARSDHSKMDGSKAIA